MRFLILPVSRARGVSTAFSFVLFSFSFFSSFFDPFTHLFSFFAHSTYIHFDKVIFRGVKILQRDSATSAAAADYLLGLFDYFENLGA